MVTNNAAHAQEPGDAAPEDAHDPVIVGAAGFRYRVAAGWGALPTGWEFTDVAAVGVDASDNVYVFNRGAHPMIVFNRAGEFLRSWGEGTFSRPHGLHIAPDGYFYCTDDGDHTVRKCTSEGKVVLTIGVPGKPSPYFSGDPFHRCTHTALAPNGEIYVSDGYGNARVHKYDARGRHLLSWGEPGTDPGQFNLVHNLCCDAQGWVYVADRENHRVQVFDGSGKYEAQWNNLHRPCGLCMGNEPDPLYYIGELGPMLDSNRRFPNLGPRLSIATRHGQVLARIGPAHAGLGHGEFVAPHGLAVDSRGDIYVGEVSYTAWNAVFPDKPRPARVRTLQKLARLVE
ncbi:MAG TPA: peptidyl-alpha-hydroxyglycine alpha-amidating lyase family protein [Casimicrobiaceae bacterium]|nr:peptidyl-alpha-hydroxyglycine alpha-amidating lyase family protein [Casimicrobiaceae bacterium]